MGYNKKIKAVGLFSGGLDSILAIRLLQRQGIDVIAIAFTSPFFINPEKQKRMEKEAKKDGFKMVFLKLGTEYLRLVKKPKHGHGKNMNPCIDCHAYMIKKAKKYADKIKAKFVFTGEVLDERPMSQNYKSLLVVEKEAGLKGKLLRPLSAKRLKITEAEEKKYVDREKLMDIQGRSRKKQFALAKKLGVKSYETPAGGCLLTTEGYSNKLRNLFQNKKRVTLRDVELLKVGRHFRIEGTKIIVGRNQEENLLLQKIKRESEILLEPTTPGPSALILGKKSKLVQTVANIITSYCKEKEVFVKYKHKLIKGKSIDKEKYRIK